MELRMDRFASYPELHSRASGRLCTSARLASMHRGSAAFPDRSLEPVDPSLAATVLFGLSLLMLLLLLLLLRYDWKDRSTMVSCLGHRANPR